MIWLSLSLYTSFSSRCCRSLDSLPYIPSLGFMFVCATDRLIKHASCIQVLPFGLITCISDRLIKHACMWHHGSKHHYTTLVDANGQRRRSAATLIWWCRVWSESAHRTNRTYVAQFRPVRCWPAGRLTRNAWAHVREEESVKIDEP